MLKIILLIAISSTLFAQHCCAVPKPLPGIVVDQKKLKVWFDTYETNRQEIAMLLGSQLQKKKDDPWYINGLINSTSPYLLRHAFNPIAWQEWNETTLAQAKQSNKLIFLSVGYSSCHWCHVMEEESFADENIATILNKYYISIKVDKELSPHIDYKYTLALELSKGSSGWPISAILTPSGDVVYIDAYIKKDDFLSLLQRLAKNWEKNQSFFEESAQLMMSEVHQVMSLQGEPKKITVESLSGAYERITEKFDPDYGGLKGNVKFPEPAFYHLLLNRYQRNPSKKLKHYIEFSLNNLHEGNLYDHLYGGFYRYTTDSKYKIPHFEKMLYTQAYMVSVFAKASVIIQESRYLDIALRTLEFTDDWLESKEGLYYSAIDADYEGVEGGFYIWELKDKEDFENASKQKVAWTEVENGYLPAYPLSVNQANSLTSFWNQRKSTRPFIDKKIVVSWNAFVASAYLDLYESTQDIKYFTKAKAMAGKLWDKAWSIKEKRLGRVIVNGRMQGYFDIEDSIDLALVFIKLHKHTGSNEFAEKAALLFESIENNYLSAASQEANLYDLKQLEAIASNDGEGFSSLTKMLELVKEMSMLLKKNNLKYKSNQLEKVIATRFLNNSLARLSAHTALENSLNGKIDLTHYFANGNGVAALTMGRDKNTLRIKIKLDKGWHVNSDNPVRKELIATEVKLLMGGISLPVKVVYPQAINRHLGFTKGPLSLFNEEFFIDMKLDENYKQPALIELRLQACSDTLCLLPEKLLFPLY